MFLWLAIDAEIRQRTHDRKSLDDFAREFFGSGEEGALTLATYTFDDVCTVLQRIAPGDWATFLRSHLDSHDARHVLAGLENEGYRLVFDATQRTYSKQSEMDAGARDFLSAIGLTIGKGGVIKAVSWNGPALRAGLAPGARIDAINGKAHKPESLDDMLASTTPSSLKLTATMDGRTSTVTLQPSGPIPCPHLEHIEGARDRLGELLRARPSSITAAMAISWCPHLFGGRHGVLCHLGEQRK